ncbi:MAG TPA: neutral zinc metallopeptidase [Vicinamibacterales bacterium]
MHAIELIYGSRVSEDIVLHAPQHCTESVSHREPQTATRAVSSGTELPVQEDRTRGCRHVVPQFVRHHVGLGEFARRSEPLPQFVEETEVQVDEVIGGAIERPRRRLHRATGQMLLGIDRRVRAAQQARSSQANALSVALELQADCFAGVWGHAASQPGRAQRGEVELDGGDAEARLRAAAAIGDDRIQRMATGRVFPERFTHGSSEQRVTWFNRGLTSGSLQACNTLGGGQ